MSKISADVNLKTSGPRVPMQPLYYLMLFLGIVSALWLHGHPLYTLTMMAMTAVAAAASYLPWRLFPLRFRLATMLLLVAAAFVWGFLRFKERIPVDKVLIEAICLLALSFSFSPRRQDYGYMLLISGLLLLYGALLPRGIYLAVIPGAFMLIMIVLCGTRTTGISGDYDLPQVSVFKYCWGKIILQIMIISALWFYFFTWFPTEESTRSGLFLTSFKNPNTSILPASLNTWFKPNQVRVSTQGSVFPGSNKPTASGKSGPQVKAKSQTGLRSSGNGSSLPGKDLVFRAKSPVKLYWLGQLYDVYDGDAWQHSDTLQRQRGLRKSKFSSRLIAQDIILEKWISPVLYSAYRADFCNLDTKQMANVEGNFYQFRFKPKVAPPSLPFSYTVNSEVDSTRIIRRREEQWLEWINPKYYLQLPQKKISNRLRTLVNRLTFGIEDDYQRAIILRDYLRNNYKYLQLSKPPPEKHEAVDFFIFELKEGHCEYFASSLAVMARLAGLPSRIATGFSPGNYNALTKFFEIYEYHGHAWTQIYIKRYGWLTFDATPPGAIESRTTPLAIGALQDPFGDEWKVKPPELAAKVQEQATPEWMSGTSRKQEEESVMDKALYDLVMMPETVSATIDRVMKNADEKSSKNKTLKKLKTHFDNAVRSLQQFFRSIHNRYLNMFDWLRKNIWKGLALVALITLLLAALPVGIERLRRQYVRLRCRKLLQAAADNCEKDPSQAVRLCYLAVRKMLYLAGVPRRGNIDLFVYAALLRRLDRVCGHAAMTVFFLYSRIEYGRQNATPEQARAALNAALRLREEAHRLKSLRAEQPDRIPPAADSGRNPDHSQSSKT